MITEAVERKEKSNMVIEKRSVETEDEDEAKRNMMVGIQTFLTGHSSQPLLGLVCAQRRSTNASCRN